MAFVTAPNFAITQISWSLNQPAQINTSAYTGARSVVANPWYSQWSAHVNLATVQDESNFRPIRSFLVQCKGSANTFRLYATAGPQNSNTGVTLASAAAQGTTAISITGYSTPLLDGQFFTINGQLCCCIGDQSGSLVTFQPMLRQAAASGTVVVTSQPYALVYMTNADVGYQIGNARLFTASFDVTEAILESDGTAPEAPPVPYLGVAATRAFMLGDTLDATNTQAILRTAHYARDNLSSFQLLFSDWRGGAETGAGAATTISAVIEYPIGVTRTRVTFSASNNGTVPDGGKLLSDAISVSIPKGAKFYIRQFKRNANGFVYNQYELANSALGDLVQVAASGLTDNLMTGDPTSNSTFVMAPAVISMTVQPSVLIIGDSRAVGVTDTAGGNASGDAGEIARSIGPNYGYVKMAMAGETAATAQGNSPGRVIVAPYVTHVISNFGINDVRGGESLSLIQGYLETLWGTIGADRYVFQTTVAPSELSGSPESTNSVRTALNDWLRANPKLPTGGVIELADVVESARNSGLWKSGYTTDLIHENATGYQAIQDAGIFPVLPLLPVNPYPANPASVLLYPSTFSQGGAAWTKEHSAVTENTTTAPNGMRSADTLAPTASSGEHRVYQSILSATYTKSVHAKALGARYISIGGGATSVPYAVFDLFTGTVVTTGAGATATCVASANGFYLCTVSGGAATTFMVINIGDTSAHAVPGTTWTATGSESVCLWQAQAV